MIHRHQLGQVPAKPHTAFYEGDKLLMEQCVTREGFEGPFSILYYRIPPTDETRVEQMGVPGFCPFEMVEEQPLHRRHVKTQDIRADGDFLTARRTLMVNSDVQIGVCKANRPADRFFSNADGDECWFAYDRGGVVESVYGILPYRKHDYVLIPKATPYRIHPEGGAGTFLVFEGRGYIDIPKQWRNKAGQITMYAPYTHRDFRAPEALLRFDEKKHGKGLYPLVIKKDDRLTVHVYEHFPYELVGWDGFVYPVAFNIHDYQPRTGLIHLPPTIHLTFAGNDFVICSFVPRKVDYHEKSIPCPYGHASPDCDEILYYVDGTFTSRKGIESQSISLHPAGVPHGPHPGTYAKSIGTRETQELAVMCDTLKPLRLTKFADGIEDKDYHFSWVRRENEGMGLSK
ncbi:MAG: homogentisate 1,2-dioxygenase [Phycisphaerales bacterium]|nr:homogentisate 1,2-dioxygenase [Phycisphaerales bacterium]